MKLTLVPILALAASFNTVLSAPITARAQHQIQTLEITIVNVVNDMIHSATNARRNYHSGLDQFATLVGELQGPQPCPIGLPAPPRTKEAAISYLNSATAGLQQLSQDLNNPAYSVRASSFQAQICSTADYYEVVRGQVGA